MRCSNSGQTKTAQIVRGVGPLMASAFLMMACAGAAFADTLAATAQQNGDAYLVALANDWDPLPEQWRRRSADGLQLTGIEREDEKEVEEMEEIVVIANPQGRATLEYERQRLERMREAMYAELRRRERGVEEMAWWEADPDLEDAESLIKWGYSPQAEYRMRRDNDFIHALSTDHVQPASVIRIAF